MNSSMTVPGLLYLCSAGFFLLLLVRAFKKLRIYKLTDYLVIFYLGVLLTTVLGLMAEEVGWLDVLIRDVVRHLPNYGLLLSAGFLYLLTYNVFRDRNPGWWSIPLNLSLLGTAVILDTNLLGLPEVLLAAPWQEVTRFAFTSKLLSFSWGLYLVLILLEVLRCYRRSAKPLIKKRAAFWAVVLVIYTGASVLFLIRQHLPGAFLLVLSGVGLSYLVLTYRLPDLRYVIVAVLSHGTSGVISLLLYALGFLLLEGIFINRRWYEPVYTALFMGVWLLVIYPGLQNTVRATVESLLDTEIDRQEDLRTFSRRMSSILDIDLLSQVTIDLICEVLEVERGFLYLVDEQENQQGPSSWSLRAVQGAGEAPPDLEHLPGASPVAKVLRVEKRPLTQSELEMIPRYQTLPENIVHWLEEVEADTFVPIHTEDDWIGLFALPLKKTGASFTEEDLEFLMTLADQTSVALQNARLAENLTNIDHELRRAQASTNTMLDRISRIKRSASDFISLKAHELRTPLTVMSGYTQLLANDDKLMADEYYTKLIKGILSGSESLQKIIDNMLYTASIQPGAVTIDSEPISLLSMIDSISRELGEKVQVRKITLSHDGLGTLPEVYGDSTALRKVFRYLINYAMTHTPSGGKITITGRHLPLQSDLLRWEGVEVVIRDTGIGIDPDAQQRLFRDFALPAGVSLREIDQNRDTGQKSGEQLAYVRSIVESHNGRIWVELLEKDKEHLPGSEFHIVLPLQQQTHPTRPVE
jgi:signal transduction histidine kinase